MAISREKLLRIIQHEDTDQDMVDEWIATNESTIKEIFPRTATNVANINNDDIIDQLVDLGVVIETEMDFITIMAFLYNRGIFRFITDYQIVRNNASSVYEEYLFVA